MLQARLSLARPADTQPLARERQQTAAAGANSRSRKRMMPISLESRGRTSGRHTRFE